MISPANKKPHFDFVNLEDTQRLSFELVDKQNYLAIYELFKTDSNKHIIDEYKHLDKLEQYIEYTLSHQRYAVKRAGCDWLFRLKETGEYIGILNLYDLSLETFNDNHKKCMIGFNTKASHRRKYYTLEAVNQLIYHIFHHFKMEKIIANTNKDNHASKALLQKLNFVDKTEDFYYRQQYDYWVLEKE